MTARVAEPAYAQLLHEFEVLGGYTLDLRVETALTGLGFTREEWAKPPSALSGGEQTRASLARLVIADPDLLLLDEPTNHLDLDALEWLEEHLRRRTGSLLVASHDRAFLDATVTRVWELRDRRLTAFRGDYSAYHRQRVERDARTVKDVETQAEAIAREKELVQRYRSHRKFSKMHEHEARLERLEARAARGARGRTEAGDPDGGAARRRRARRGAARSSSGSRTSRSATCRVAARWRRMARPRPRPKLVARVPFLAAQRGDRIGIVGPNGAGKTTLLRTIAGDLPPLDGTVTFGNAVQIGYLAQLRSAAIAGRDRPRRADRGGPGHRRRGARLPRPLPVPRRRRVQGGPAAVGRRALAARARVARHPAVEPAAARRADEPPRHPGARGDRGVHGGVAGDAAGRLARPAAARDGVREAVGGGRRVGGGVRGRVSGVAGGGREWLDDRGGARAGGGAVAWRESPPAPVTRRRSLRRCA